MDKVPEETVSSPLLTAFARPLPSMLMVMSS